VKRGYKKGITSHSRRVGEGAVVHSIEIKKKKKGGKEIDLGQKRHSRQGS